MFVTADIAVGAERPGDAGAGERAVGGPAHRPARGLCTWRRRRPAPRQGRRRRRPARCGCARSRCAPRAAAPSGSPGSQPGEWVVTLGQHLLAAATAAGHGARVRAGAPGSACSSCSRGSTRICWPASWRSSSAWRARLGAVPPTTDQVRAAGAGGRGRPRRADGRRLAASPCRCPRLVAAPAGGHLDGLPDPAGGRRGLLAQPAGRSAAPDRVHPAHRARALPQRRPAGDRADHHQPHRERRRRACPTWNA